MKRIIFGLLAVSSLSAHAGHCGAKDSPRPALSQYPSSEDYLSWDSAYEEALDRAKLVAATTKLYGSDGAGNACSIEFIEASACHPWWSEVGRSVYRPGETKQLMKLKVKVSYVKTSVTLQGDGPQLTTYSANVSTSASGPVLPLGNGFEVVLKTDQDSRPIEYKFKQTNAFGRKVKDINCKNLI